MNQHISPSEMLTIDINKALEFINHNPDIRYRDMIEQQIEATVCSFKEVKDFVIERKECTDINLYPVTVFKWKYTIDDGKYGCKIAWRN